MGQLLTWLAVLGFFAGVIGLLVWQGSRIRRRPRGGTTAVVGPWQEIWHPTAYRARLETEVVEERMLPNPSPDSGHVGDSARQPPLS